MSKGPRCAAASPVALPRCFTRDEELADTGDRVLGHTVDAVYSRDRSAPARPTAHQDPAVVGRLDGTVYLCELLNAPRNKAADVLSTQVADRFGRAAGMGSRKQCRRYKVYVNTSPSTEHLPTQVGLRLTLADFIVWYPGVRDGLALRRADILWMTPSQALKAARMNLFLLLVFYALAVGFAKIAVLALYWRTFSLGRLRYPIIVLTVCSVLWTVIRVCFFSSFTLNLSAEKHAF